MIIYIGIEQKSPINKICFKYNFRVNQIIYLEACKNHTLIYVDEGRCIKTGYHLKRLLISLESFPNFKRVSRSYGINIDFIEMESLDRSRIYMKNGAIIPQTENV